MTSSEAPDAIEPTEHLLVFEVSDFKTGLRCLRLEAEKIGMPEEVLFQNLHLIHHLCIRLPGLLDLSLCIHLNQYGHTYHLLSNRNLPRLLIFAKT